VVKIKAQGNISDGTLISHYVLHATSNFAGTLLLDKAYRNVNFNVFDPSILEIEAVVKY
jgi:hypothetical protein